MRDPLYKDELESYLTEQSDQHRMYPSDRVWRGIQDSLHEKGRWPALTFIFLFIISLLVAGTLLVRPEEHLRFIHKTPYLMAGHVSIATADSLVPKLSESLATGKTTEQTIAYANERLQLQHVVDDTVVPASADSSMTYNPVVVPAVVLLTVAPVHLLPEQNVSSSWTALPDAVIAVNPPTTSFSSTLSLAGVPAPVAVPAVAMPVAADPAASVAAAAPMPEIVVPRQKSKRWDLHVYASPSASYRRLVEEKSTKEISQYLSTPMAPNYLIDVNRVVRHTPARGFEVGFAVGYQLNDRFSLRAGLQYNTRQYNIEASGYSYEATTIVLNGRDTINTYTPYRNIKGNYPVTLHNKYHEISLPVGIQWTGWTSGRFGWGASATLQPTYTFNKQPFIISTDFKNYANGKELTRRWNVNTSFETYISYTIGDFRWQIGPQFRYQQLSSFKQQYPIKEFLLDYGIKIGFTTPL